MLLFTAPFLHHLVRHPNLADYLTGRVHDVPKRTPLLVVSKDELGLGLPKDLCHVTVAHKAGAVSEWIACAHLLGLQIPIPNYWDWLAAGAPELRDMRRRLWWANEEGQTLYDDIAQFTGSDPHGMFIEFDGERWHVSFHRVIEKRAEWDQIERFTRVLGVFLDNNRAALNYLAIALGNLAVEQDPSLVDPSLPWKERFHPESLEFHIFAKKAKWFSEGANKISKLPKPIRVAINEIQPYLGGHKGLWGLQVLAAEYRHRVIHPIAVVPHRHLFKVVLDGIPVKTVDMEIFVEDGPIKHGDKVMDFSVTGVPANRYKDLKPQITVSIGLDHSLCRGRDCIGVINRISEDVIGVVDKFETLFF